MFHGKDTACAIDAFGRTTQMTSFWIMADLFVNVHIEAKNVTVQIVAS